VPSGDNRPRFVCSQCQTIFYENPKIVAGCIPHHGDQVLMCRRAIEPRHGFWTLPAGFMENDETVQEAAIRETIEEAGARVKAPQLYSVFSLPHINQVYMMYRAELADLDFQPGEESLDAGLYTSESMPWAELAFPVVEQTLKLFFADLPANRFPVHHGDIRKLQADPPQYQTTLF